jgi:adenosine deaminase
MIPKADLHCHIEGTTSPDLLRRLAARNGVTLSPKVFTPGGDYAWADFLSFLATYDAATQAIRTPQDYRDVMYEHLARGAAEGMIYAEVFASPDHADESGLGYTDMLAGLASGIADAERDFGLTARVITIAVRHLGPERAEWAAGLAAKHPHPLVTGFGMAGDEAFGRVADYERAFAIAADAGLACTVHAGEVVGPQSVRDALDLLPVVRLGHGVRSIEDPELVARISAEGIALEVCPGSNLALSLYAGPADHPLPRLLAAGCRVALGADDPPFFATSIGREYALAAEMGIGPDAQIAITRTAVEVAFVDPATRADLRARLDGLAGATGSGP